MTTEVKAKKNTDYSASAVKLCNPEDVKNVLQDYLDYQKMLGEAQAAIDALIPQNLKDNLESVQKSMDVAYNLVKKYIDSDGSYQDTETGHYAIKQRKLSKSYSAEAFEKNYPQFSPAVIIKAVDTAKLNGLIKGGLLDEARLEADNVLKISESYAYIIK